jgi:hypothetical protein
MYTAQALLGQGAAANALGGAGYPIWNPSPICYQTSTYNQMGSTATDLMNTLDYAIWLGARMVELPSGWDTALTAAQLGAYNAGLFANDPAGGGPSSQVVQHVQGGTSGDSTTLTVENAATTVGNTCVLMVGVRAASAPTASISGGGTWNNRFSTNSGAGTGNLSGWDLVPAGAISANGITITSTQSGSIEYEFWEISGLASTPYEKDATATGSSASPTVSVTPSNSTDVVLGGIFWPNGSSTIGSLPGAWSSDPTIVGIG